MIVKIEMSDNFDSYFKSYKNYINVLDVRKSSNSNFIKSSYTIKYKNKNMADICDLLDTFDDYIISIYILN